MSQDYRSGDFLIFQIESGFGLLRLLEVEIRDGKRIWHLSAYNEMFLDPESADLALKNPGSLTVTHPHLALTTRAFESTQTARMLNVPLKEAETSALRNWKDRDDKAVSDRSVRLLLGLR